MERLRRMADRVISERPSDRVLNFTLDGEKYWIKRKLGNGRNQLVKYSVEKEFYYEIARMTIAGRNNPDLVPEIEVLTPDYMVTKDGGPTVKNWLDSDKSEAEKELILEEAGVHDVRLASPATRGFGATQETFIIELKLDGRRYGRTLGGAAGTVQ